jgi:5-methylcytosine-specific restriction endonuclease McrA
MEGILARQVLVLNRCWQAVNVVGMKRAFSLLIQGHADVIHQEEGDFQLYDFNQWLDSSEYCEDNTRDYLHTVSHFIRLPKVIILKFFDRLPIKEVKFHRKNIFERDSFRCQYCGKAFKESELNLDHVIPRHHGGRTSWENVVASCINCNSRKADRLPHEAGMHLIRKPLKPKWRPFVAVAENKHRHRSWDYFLNPLQGR